MNFNASGFGCISSDLIVQNRYCSTGLGPSQCCTFANVSAPGCTDPLRIGGKQHELINLQLLNFDPTSVQNSVVLWKPVQSMPEFIHDLL